MMQWLFDLTLGSPGPLTRFAHRVRHRLSRAWNPDVRWRFEGRTLAVPLSHDFAWNRALFPAYTDNLTRLAAFLRERDGALSYVDVGANVGDTWLLTHPAAGDRALLVEGAPRYFELLRHNVGADRGVTCVQALLSDRAGSVSGGVAYDGGNAFVDPSLRGAGAVRTLDEVVAAHPEHAKPNLLKVDVEGWDGRVLRGARTLLADAAPVVIFEHHPRLMDAIGEDPAAVFSDLAAAGYGDMIVYDNFGALVATVSPSDRAALDRLVATARGRDGFYHDVIAFPARRAADRDAFLARERA